MAEQKSWIEVIIMPVVVALVGIGGTYFITQQQGQSAELARQTELDKAQETAAADRQIKALELFVDKIQSPDERERKFALRLLKVVDGNLATQLATAVSEDEDEKPQIRKVAAQVAKDAAARGFSFPVVASRRTFDEARGFASKVEGILDAQEKPFTTAIYLSENGYYAVTLGGYLTQDEARSRAQYAKSSGIASDAYVRSSRNWGENLIAD